MTTDELLARDPAAPHPDTVRRLTEEYLHRLRGPELPDDRLSDARPDEVQALERTWIASLDAQVDRSRLPTSKTFRAWFEQIALAHVQEPFCEYLRSRATLVGLAVFVAAEEKVDGRFDDLMALAQIGLWDDGKMVVAHNYWDEMGSGRVQDMHTVQFSTSVTYMRGVLADAGVETEAIEHPACDANAAVLLAYGTNPQYALRALGAMGVLEASASPRFEAMVDGFMRVGAPEEVVKYQRIHIDVDAGHGADWLDHLLVPLASRSDDHAAEIAMGVLTRVLVADAYYEAIWGLMRRYEA